jgi:hypothetical protein
MTLRRNKYNAKKTMVDGHLFDSQKEAKRYFELKCLQAAGEVWKLELQPKFDLMVNGVKVGTYIADFRYETHDGKVIIEDVKSPVTKTPVYNLKKKILATYKPPVVITEII